MNKPAGHVVQGEEYPSIAALARAYGMSYTLVRGRIYRGWTPTEAVFIPHESREFVVSEGESYPTLSHAARAYGLPPKLVHRRYNDFGWSPRECLKPRTRPWETARQKLRAKRDSVVNDDDSPARLNEHPGSD